MRLLLLALLLPLAAQAQAPVGRPPLAKGARDDVARAHARAAAAELPRLRLQRDALQRQQDHYGPGTQAYQDLEEQLGQVETQIALDEVWVAEGTDPAPRAPAGKEGPRAVYANLRSARLAGRDLSGRDLTGATLRGADLRGAKLRDCDLFCACLIEADLRGADLRGARLTGAQLDYARCDAETLWPAGYDARAHGAGYDRH